MRSTYCVVHTVHIHMICGTNEAKRLKSTLRKFLLGKAGMSICLCPGILTYQQLVLDMMLIGARYDLHVLSGLSYCRINLSKQRKQAKNNL